MSNSSLLEQRARGACVLRSRGRVGAAPLSCDKAARCARRDHGAYDHADDETGVAVRMLVGVRGLVVVSRCEVRRGRWTRGDLDDRRWKLWLRLSLSGDVDPRELASCACLHDRNRHRSGSRWRNWDSTLRVAPASVDPRQFLVERNSLFYTHTHRGRPPPHFNFFLMIY